MERFCACNNSTLYQQPQMIQHNYYQGQCPCGAMHCVNTSVVHGVVISGPPVEQKTPQNKFAPSQSPPCSTRRQSYESSPDAVFMYQESAEHEIFPPESPSAKTTERSKYNPECSSMRSVVIEAEPTQVFSGTHQSCTKPSCDITDTPIIQSKDMQNYLQSLEGHGGSQREPSLSSAKSLREPSLSSAKSLGAGATSINSLIRKPRDGSGLSNTSASQHKGKDPSLQSIDRLSAHQASHKRHDCSSTWEQPPVSSKRSQQQQGASRTQLQPVGSKMSQIKQEPSRTSQLQPEASRTSQLQRVSSIKSQLGSETSRTSQRQPVGTQKSDLSRHSNMTTESSIGRLSYSSQNGEEKKDPKITESLTGQHSNMTAESKKSLPKGDPSIGKYSDKPGNEGSKEEQSPTSETVYELTRECPSEDLAREGDGHESEDENDDKSSHKNPTNALPAAEPTNNPPVPQSDRVPTEEW